MYNSGTVGLKFWAQLSEMSIMETEKVRNLNLLVTFDQSNPVEQDIVFVMPGKTMPDDTYDASID